MDKTIRLGSVLPPTTFTDLVETRKKRVVYFMRSVTCAICRAHVTLLANRRDKLSDADVTVVIPEDAQAATKYAKELPFQEAEAGATGVELLLPLTLKWARETGMPLGKALGFITRHPANIMRIDAGRIGVGCPADLCMFDPEATWVVNRANLASLGKNSPFLGLEMQGRVQYTLIDGHLDYRRNHQHA